MGLKLNIAIIPILGIFLCSFVVYIYLLQTEFEDRTVNYGPRFPRFPAGREASFKLNLAGRTVEYGPQNWPMTAPVLSKGYNKYICHASETPLQ